MGDLLSGMDLCFNPNNLGTSDGEGHYPLGYGLIQRANTSSTWSKVNGFSESVTKNTDFVINLFDLSGTVSQIDFVNISWRPSADSPGKANADSPFSQSDFDDMQEGKALTSVGAVASCGCGVGGSTPTGNAFEYGTYTFKNEGPFEVTIEMRITVNGQSLEFKCDPKIIVGG
jgi:hypothetical protein